MSNVTLVARLVSELGVLRVVVGCLTWLALPCRWVLLVLVLVPVALLLVVLVLVLVLLMLLLLVLAVGFGLLVVAEDLEDLQEDVEELRHCFKAL